VNETRIAFSSRVRCKNLIGMAVVALGFGTAGVMNYLAVTRGHASVEGWVCATVWAGPLVPSVFYGVNRTLGKTILSHAGMRFSTFVSRRFIPWDQITEIEVQTRTGRGQSWQVVRAHRRSGRPLVIPGVMPKTDSTAEFEEKLRTICSFWEEATEQPRTPVYTR